MKPALVLLALLIPSASAGTVANQMFLKAVASGNLYQIELLLTSGFDPNLAIDGYTPLCHAMRLNRIDAVRVLLLRHADPNTPVKGGGDFNGLNPTPLQFAIDRDNHRLALMLISAGARLETRNEKGRTVLHLAARGYIEALRILIDAGADVNARDFEGAGPLDSAVWVGNLDAVAILLAHGARLDEPDTGTGATPINEAAFRGDAALVRYLLRFRPDLTIPDKRGYLPLDNAIRSGKEECALPLLDAMSKDSLTSSVLAKTMESASKKDQSLVVTALLQRGVSADGPLPSGLTPLTLAASSGSVKAVRALLDTHADPNVPGQGGSTPLEEASLRGLGAIAGLLLDHGAQIDHVNSGSGTTALYAAASFGKAGVVKLLLDRGATANLCGSNRKTPYQVALDNGYSDIASAIKAPGGSASCRP